MVGAANIYSRERALYTCGVRENSRASSDLIINLRAQVVINECANRTHGFGVRGLLFIRRFRDLAYMRSMCVCALNIAIPI